MYNAPSLAFRITGASSTFSIVKLLWLSEGGKPHSPIAWFVALNTSFKDQTLGSRVFRFQPEHPRTTYEEAEADDWPTLRFNKTAAQEVKFKINNKHYITYQSCFHHTGWDNMKELIQ